MRAYTSGRFAVEIEGIDAGWVYSVEGGHPSADVVQEKLGPEHSVKKHIGGLKYDDITITCGTGMSKGFWETLHKSFTDDFKRFDGTIFYADYDGKIRKTVDFHGAPITEIGFPALDAASKDAAKLTLKLSPEWTKTRFHKGGESLNGRFQIDPSKQKQWSPANFRLDIDGLHDACSRVNKIDAITLKQKVAQNQVGESRDYSVEPCAIEVPNLVITTPESHARKLYRWREEFLERGNNTEEHEKHGTLEYLTSDLKDVLFSIDMHHLGVFKMTPDKGDALGESISRVKVEMYVEHMKMKFHGGSTWA
jgi:hypothetical protein